MIRVPENWPCAWWGPGTDLVRMSCPACGHFSLYADRSNGKPKIECRECSLSGVKAVQAALDAWGAQHEAALAADAAAHEEALAEGATATAMVRQAATKRMT